MVLPHQMRVAVIVGAYDQVDRVLVSLVRFPVLVICKSVDATSVHPAVKDTWLDQ